MTRQQGMGRFVAVLAALTLAGCGTADLFGKYSIPESAHVAEAPWPRLVDVPNPPPPGTYTEDVPDPAAGIVLRTDLPRVAAHADARAAKLKAPVIDPDIRAAMEARARQARQARQRD